LPGQPVDDLDRVILFELDVFVIEQTVRLAGAAHIHPDHSVSLGRKIAVHRIVAPARAFAFVVGNVFQDHGRRRAPRQPKPRREARAVAHRHPKMLCHRNSHEHSPRE
jgi:hypothetical protein